MNVQGCNPTTSHVVKKMTTEELSEQRKNGLCFHYNDKYSPGHKCKRLFMIEANWVDEDDGDVVMENDEETQETFLEISLHAMAEVQVPKTMKIWGDISGQPVLVLVDSGSTQNFISTLAAKQISIQPNSNSKLEVLVASSKRLVSPSKCS